MCPPPLLLCSGAPGTVKGMPRAQCPVLRSHPSERGRCPREASLQRRLSLAQAGQQHVEPCRTHQGQPLRSLGHQVCSEQSGGGAPCGDPLTRGKDRRNHDCGSPGRCARGRATTPGLCSSKHWAQTHKGGCAEGGRDVLLHREAEDPKVRAGLPVCRATVPTVQRMHGGEAEARGSRAQGSQECKGPGPSRR